MLRFLLVSDLHYAVDKVKELKTWMDENNREVDIILVSGDLVNMVPSENDNEAKIKESEEMITEILMNLEEININVIYIPGNHDPVTTFDRPLPQLSEHSKNIHYSNIRIIEKLLLCGFGGSVPAYQENEEGILKKRWEGYPFKNDDEFKDQLEHIFSDDIVGEDILDDDKIILMTHTGPNQSNTVQDQTDLTVPVIHSGSDSLREFLLEDYQQKHVLLNIHGHTHHSTGLSRVGRTYILNPGSIRTGHFAILTLKFNGSKNKWMISGAEFHRLI
eukprot:TRINITY_DN6181_c0_g1_i1.p1 TRINITY_DN6181_c0_g1~~TRINITY_DN6181_c0_g1_i1.p1  ORF type:complete len:275 (+),score=88.45 TRINITY_DN6181_c0_g1_i1:50-874(+)